MIMNISRDSALVLLLTLLGIMPSPAIILCHFSRPNLEARLQACPFACLYFPRCIRMYPTYPLKQYRVTLVPPALLSIQFFPIQAQSIQLNSVKEEFKSIESDGLN
ncbi:hypothetical protein BGZ61DRAFT_467561 [Ilyonectria robusta]|uniref:uncharacterized protein n=1 Tax=Ilyonectria robusta TaxID=1079257 RepID=UPI001E8D3706|nr:uncharacterized protein BGZ61DRAFT_467561 [Ilyonectria robusta]KAH8654659.1 hypothetical protein BGZ61DRAFT_467561 [Ilyonectria robusta]